MLNFCTYFDHNYLPRGLALYHSLREHCPAFRLWVLCMSPLCHEILTKLNLQNVEIISLQIFEKNDCKLKTAKKNRSLVEYYFTCTPSLPIFIFENYPDVDLLTYIDSDFYFFSDPSFIVDKIRNYSITITRHRFPLDYTYLEQIFGIYNVGWLTFRRDDEALSCLNRWREQCIEWCYDRLENGRFADQMYLDDWPNRYSNVGIIEHLGINVAPYNLANYNLTIKNGCIFIDEEPLICFHFFGLKNFLGFIFYLSLNRYGARPTKTILNHIYEPYLQSMKKIKYDTKPLLLNAVAIKSTQRNLTQKMAPMRLPKSIEMLTNYLKRLRIATSAIFHRRFVIFLYGHIRFKIIPCGFRSLRS